MFSAVIDEEGYRTTSSDPRLYRNKPQLWMFGCSYTWGWPLNDRDSFPWIIQSRFSGLQVKNFAVSGYGNAHQLIQFRQMLLKKNKPLIAVFSYNHFHLPRNVAAPSRMLEFQSLDKANMMHHPQAYLDSDGALQIRSIPIVPVDAPEPTESAMILVTQRIFTEIYRLAKENNVKPVLAFQTGDAGDPIVVYAKKIGFIIADISVDNSQARFNLLPYDPHPNAKAHQLYADKLTPVLCDIMH